jgi:polar amino acid transport system substrate-binding protein
MRKRSTLTLLLSLPCGALWGRPAERERVRVVLGEWAPMLGAGLPRYGVVAQLIEEVFASADIAVDFEFRPWQRAYAQVRSGQSHASALWGRTPEREAVCDFSDIIFSDDLVLFFRKDKPLAWDGKAEHLAALRGITIGLPLGSAKAEPLAQAERRGELRFEASGDELSNLHKLLVGRFDAVDLSRTIGNQLLLRRFSAAERALIGHTPSYQQWHYRMIFSRKAPQHARYLALFDQGLKRLKANGRYQELMARLPRDPAR